MGGSSKEEASFQKVQMLKRNSPKPKEPAPLGIQSRNIIIVFKEHCFYFFIKLEVLFVYLLPSPGHGRFGFYSQVVLLVNDF